MLLDFIPELHIAFRKPEVIIWQQLQSSDACRVVDIDLAGSSAVVKLNSIIVTGVTLHARSLIRFNSSRNVELKRSPIYNFRIQLLPIWANIHTTPLSKWYQSCVSSSIVIFINVGLLRGAGNFPSAMDVNVKQLLERGVTAVDVPEAERQRLVLTTGWV